MGSAKDWFPALLAVSGDKRLYGWDALEKQGKSGWTILRSLKRLLKNAGPDTAIDIAGQQFNMSLVITEMMAALRRELMEKSTLGARKYDKLQAMLGVPANANSNQRFLTQEAARAAGFEVLGLLNEPSAAAVEFACRNARPQNSRKGRIAPVYTTWAAAPSTRRWWSWENRSARSSPRMAFPILAATILTRSWRCWRCRRPESPAKPGVASPGRSGTCCLTSAARRRNRSIPTAAR